MIQIPEVFIVVKGISHKKLVWNFKPNKVRPIANTSRGPFHKQAGNLDHLWIMPLDQGKQGLHCFTSVNDIFNKNDYSDPAVMKSVVAVRQYSQRLGFSQKWITNFVYKVVMLAKKEPKPQDNEK